MFPVHMHEEVTANASRVWFANSPEVVHCWLCPRSPNSPEAAPSTAGFLFLFLSLLSLLPLSYMQLWLTALVGQTHSVLIPGLPDNLVRRITT